ncbi:hypothetical protein DM02DRAFT_657248 [Periconia macrospinosa]|uniref:Uncharacterized protein n=1 Tax=Periconia macrospinosa TaxID=97972 RepID=A0A2V1DKE8_9PLEO|nr:hypothetical protein DM02DRAFT_657248 [Periconia macrospinosa]
MPLPIPGEYDLPNNPEEREKFHGQSTEVVPIAVVGMSLNFPGDSNTPESFWDMITNARCASMKFPKDRLGGSALYHPDPNRTDSVPLQGGHFINEELGTFDAPFFNIGAAEAMALDPHARMLLETTYRALENAGISLDKVSGSNTSCYTGNLSTDFRSFLSQDLDQTSKQSIGCLSSLMSGRLSWFFNLHGPNLTLDTACSSGLVALDLGCNSLQTNAASMSIVTGCCLLFSEELFHFLSNFGMLSPDSKCFSFDHRCNGYGRGEGIAALILKRLPDALKDGDTIRGVIRSIGTNHDGRTPGISYPNKEAQVALIQETYRKAGLSMEPTRYFEAHGTGTPTGDTIEAYAIGRVFKQIRSSDDPLFVGSVKANIGHLEGASGLAAVIKACLMLEKGIIPRSANFEKLNPRIDDIGLNIRASFAVESRPWPTDGLRRISVNSFGASGTNAHAVLDDVYHYLKDHQLHGNHMTTPAPQQSALSVPLVQSMHTNGNGYTRNGNGFTTHDQFYINDQEMGHRFHLLMFSAFDKLALQRMIELYDQWLKERTMKLELPAFLQNLAYTLNVRRSLHQFRSFAIIDIENIASPLKSIISSPIRANKDSKAGFVFTGQGAQWAGMARELLCWPKFYETISFCQDYLGDLGFPYDIRALLRDIEDSYGINRPLISQTICTVIQIGICDLFEHAGLSPSVVVGHSSGEIAAAYCAGALSKCSALRLAYYRGVHSEHLAEKKIGGMMAVGLSPENVHPILDEISDSTHSLCIACINSPGSVTVSGSSESLDRLDATLRDRNIFHRRLLVDAPYHSSHMESVAKIYARDVNELSPPKIHRKVKIMISSVTGDVVEHKELRNVTYWVKNMLQTVRFSEALARMCYPPRTSARKKLDGSHRNSITIQSLIEIGPHAALQGPIRETLESKPASTPIQYYSALKRNAPADKTVLTTLGNMACQGISVDFAAINLLGHNNHDPKNFKTLVDLPEYPFDHSRKYWLDGRQGREFRFRRNGKLDLVGKPVIDWNPLEARWRNFIKLSELPWAEDHKINGAIIYPAVGMIVMAIEASKQLADPHRSIKGYKVTDVKILAPLNIPTNSQGVETSVCLIPLQGELARDASSWRFSLYSHEKNDWLINCRANIEIEYEEEDDAVNEGKQELELLEDRVADFRHALSTQCRSGTKEQFYANARKSGYDYGPQMQPMSNVTYSESRGGQCTADVSCFQWREDDGRNHRQEHVVHPITLEGLLHVCVSTFTRLTSQVLSTAVPVEVESMWISHNWLNYPETEYMKCVATLGRVSNMGYETSATSFTPDLSKILLEYRGFKFRNVAKNAGNGEDQMAEPHSCYTLQWKPDVSLLGDNAFKKLDHQTTAGTISSIAEYMQLSSFKNPSLSILGIWEGPIEPNAAVFEDFLQNGIYSQKSLIHARYTLLCISENSEPDVEKFTSSYSGLHIMTAKPGESLSDILAQHTAFDIAVFTHDRVKDLLAQFGQILKIGGCSVYYDTQTCTNGSEEHNQPRAHLNGSESLNTKVVSDETRIVKDSTAKTFEFVSVIVIVQEGSHRESTVAALLLDAFAKSGIQTHIYSLYSSKIFDHIDNQKTLCIVLSELDSPLLVNLSTVDFTIVQKLLMSAHGLIWLTTQDEAGNQLPEYGMIDGLARVARTEKENSFIVNASLEPGTPENMVKGIMTLAKGYKPGVQNHGYEAEYVQKNGVFYIPRLIREENISHQVHTRSLGEITEPRSMGSCPPLRMAIGTPGLLDSLHFVEDLGYNSDLAPDDVEIKVDSVGLNFKDLLLALGRIEGNTFGFECTGIVSRVGTNVSYKPGDRVCSVGHTAFSTYTRVHSNLVARVPDALSLEHAACVPTQLGISYLGINSVAKLKKGETILIHSAAGGTGQWAIQVAQRLGGEIFATVGNAEKKQFLMREYGIAEDHIFSSRNTLFSKSILRMTNGKGVDVVLNSLAGKGLQASWNIIAPYGRFIEIGRKDISENNGLSMRPFSRNATFVALEISALAMDDMSIVSSSVESLFEDIVKGSYRMITPLRVLPISDVEKAMRMLQHGNMIGKLVLKMTDESVVPTILKTKPSFFFNPDKTYVISGGTGGLGRAIATWMVKERGAKYLLLLSRSGTKKDEAAKTVAELERAGAHVMAPPCDICDISTLQAVLDECRLSFPPFAGCFQASMVLRDSLLENMTADDWKDSVESKTRGSWNLHKLLPKGLDFFVLLSSISGIVGAAGQANYAAGNTYMDTLARYRVAQGERAISLDLGAMMGHGVLAENQTLRERLLAGGLLSGLSPAQMFGLLDYYCDPSRGLLSKEACQVVIGAAAPPKLRKKAFQDPSFSLNLPLYSHMLVAGADDEKENDVYDHAIAKHRKEFLAAENIAQAGEIIGKALGQRMFASHARTVESEDVDLGLTLHTFGVDSLMAIEIRAWFAKEFAANISIFEILGEGTLASLGVLVALKSELWRSKTAPNTEE